MASCGGSHADEPTPVTPDSTLVECAMSFSPLGDVESRDAASDAVAKALGYKFAIFAWKLNSAGKKEYVLAKDAAGTTPYIVTYTSERGWEYSTAADQFLKYWDLSAKEYTFYALANYPGSKAGALSVSFTDDGNADITDIDTSDPAAASLMDCRYMRVSSAEGAIVNDYDIWEYPQLWTTPYDPEDSPNNPTVSDPLANVPIYYRPTSQDGAPAVADIVPLPFHYLLSQVQFKVYNRSPMGGLTIPIYHATIKIYGDDGYYTTADYNSVSGFAYKGTTTGTFIDADLTDTAIKSNRVNAATLYSGVVLPQGLNLTAHIDLSTAVGHLNGTVDLGESWKGGKIYTYYLYTEYTEDLILVDTVEIDDWLPGKSKEVIQTNW